MSNEQHKYPRQYGVKIVKAHDTLVTKAEAITQLSEKEMRNAALWITPEIDMLGLKALVTNSTILPQCIRAYKSNIAGFGIGVRYKEDVAESPEMAAEYNRMTELLELLNLEQDTKEVFEDIIEAREKYGIAYLEVIRNLVGEVVQIEFIKDTATIKKTYPLDPYIDTDFCYKGKQVKRKRRFCKYMQQAGGRTVYFKEFGDKRIMDKNDGEYEDDVSFPNQANEIIEFAIGTEPYGEVRWIGQMLGVDGSRRAENLNNNYFINGRHTPLMIVIKGGTLTEDSFTKLQQYMNDIKGESGQHAFMVLEAENQDNQLAFEGEKQPEIEIKDLASILQKDELFQDYLNNARKKVQSAFQLPDLYVGYTTDFNRATAQTAMEVTEQQVFQPERKSLAWVINNRLFGEYNFKHVEAYFLEPDINNPDDLVKILNIAERAGGITPNKAKQIALEALGEVSEDYEGDWGSIPLVYSKTQQNAGEGLTEAVTQQIQKAAASNDDAVVAVMKEVRSLLKSRFTSDEECGIIKGRWVTINGNPVYIENSPSPSGANSLEVKGFASKQKLNNHWENGRTHKYEYEPDGITTAAQYAARAVELLESPVGRDIQGHITASGVIVRYDSVRNDFVKGSIEHGVYTMFKPQDGSAYYDEQREEDVKHGGKT